MIYVSFSGFGSDGPGAENWVYDLVIQAVSGMVRVQTGANGPGVRRNIVCGKVAAVTTAQAISGTVRARTRSRGRASRGADHAGSQSRLSLARRVLESQLRGRVREKSLISGVHLHPRRPPTAMSRCSPCAITSSRVPAMYSTTARHWSIRASKASLTALSMPTP
ncbi:MAG: CoA transferase [Gammaproteobacteria bacterium]|nr:CoA transferase [Gammaproteobacteria bacterium]